MNGVTIGATAEAPVECPAGWRALGGGIDEAGGTSELRASAPLDATGTVAGTDDQDVPVGWYASASNQELASDDYKVWVICAQDTNAKIKAKQVTLAGQGKRRTLSVACPSGRRIVGGGVAEEGATSLIVRANGPADATGTFGSIRDGDVARRWTATVSQDSGEHRVVRVFAVCASNSRAKVEATTVTVDIGISGVAGQAVCPGSKRATGGGFVHNAGKDIVRGQASGPLDAGGTFASTGTGDIVKSWQAGLRNATGSPVKMKVLALCE